MPWPQPGGGHVSLSAAHSDMRWQKQAREGHDRRRAALAIRSHLARIEAIHPLSLIDESLYPDEDRVDYMARLCAAWDFGLSSPPIDVCLFAGALQAGSEGRPDPCSCQPPACSL